jgi:hypothetical protein
MLLHCTKKLAEKLLCDRVILHPPLYRKTNVRYKKPHAAFAGFWSCLVAAATMWSVVNQNFF